MMKNREQHMGTEDARKMMEAGMVELAVRTAVSYYSSEAEVALALELVNRLAWHLMPCLDDLQELARRADVKKVRCAPRGRIHVHAHTILSTYAYTHSRPK
jgi:hypothetical protein